METWGFKIKFILFFMGKVVFLVWVGCVYACFGVLFGNAKFFVLFIMLSLLKIYLVRLYICTLFCLYSNVKPYLLKGLRPFSNIFG